MSPTATVALLWIGFAGTHLLLSSLPVRGRLVGWIGERPFQGLYSLVAFAFFVPLIRVFFAHKHAGDWLWGVPRTPAVVWAIDVGMAVAFVLLVAALVRPSPAGVVPGDPTPHGVYRLTRHPSMMAFVLFGLLHLVLNSSSTDVAFFGGFVLFPLVGARHQDHRKLALGTPGFATFHARTPFFPFFGGEPLRGLRELAPGVIAGGLGLAVIVRWLHRYWTG
jgi:uncharacterized membrane protein